MTLCDRCGKEADELTEIKDEFGGGEVCDKCHKEITDALVDFTAKHISPMFKKREEYVKSINLGFKLVD